MIQELLNVFVNVKTQGFPGRRMKIPGSAWSNIKFWNLRAKLDMEFTIKTTEITQEK